MIDASIDYQIDAPYVQYLREALLLRAELKSMLKDPNIMFMDRAWLIATFYASENMETRDYMKKSDIKEFLKIRNFANVALPNSLREDAIRGNTRFEDFCQDFRCETTRIWCIIMNSEVSGRQVSMRDFYDIQKEIRNYYSPAVKIKKEIKNENENVEKNTNEIKNDRNSENTEIPSVNTENKSDENSDCEIRVFEPYLPYPLESVVATAIVVVHCKKEHDNEMHRFEFQFEGCLSSDNLEWRTKDIFYI